VFNSLLVLYYLKSKIKNIGIRKQVIMTWRKHSHRVMNALIYNAKILSAKACDATFGIPNISFVAFLDNIIFTLFIRTFKTPY